jgi:hypothetical protein
MPNWCNNNIEITGPKHKLDKLLVGAKAGQLLNTLYPMPKELEDTENSNDTEKMSKQPVVDGHNNWYDWRVAKWSTKWDVDLYDDMIKVEGDGDNARLSIGFDSAWSPPIGACEEYLEHNKDCSIRLIYYEPGCDFMGIWEDFDDRCYSCSEDAPKSDSEFWETEDGRLLDDYMGIVESMQQYEEDQKEEAANG